MDVNQINQKLASLEEQWHTNEKKLKRLAYINDQLKVLNIELAEVNDHLHLDQKEIESLESKNLKSLFSELLGDKEDRLKRYKQKYLQRILKHNSLVEEIAELKLERNIIHRNVLPDKKVLRKEIGELIKLKTEALKKEPKVKAEILVFESQIFQYKAKVKEVNEANVEAIALENKFSSILKQLKQVKIWGQYRMTGKGRFSSRNKKSFIDKANREMILANIQVKKFDKELKDLYPEMDSSFGMDHVHNFLAHFYDSLITDWMIQRKLDSCIFLIESHLRKLKRIKMMLQHYKKQSVSHLSVLEIELQKFIIKA